MRPLYINGRFLGQRTTGVQRHARAVLQALDGLLATGAAPGLQATLLLPPGAEAPALQAVAVRTVAGGRGHLWEQWTLPRAARDGLLLSLAGAAPAFAAAQVATLHDAALWDQPQAYRPAFRLWYRWLFRRLARQAETLLTVSAFSRQRLAAVLGVPPARLQVVPGGAGHLRAVSAERADAALLARPELAAGRFLLAVGSANPSKNLARLVRAWARLPQAGSDNEANELTSLVLVGGTAPAIFAGGDRAAPADPPRLLRLGAVPDATLKALYQRARGLVFPSLYEGGGLPPLEAMDCGCPVIAADIPPLHEGCGDAALFVDPRDEAALAAAMARLRDDAALRAQLREAGHRQAAARDWGASAAALLAVLQPLLANPPGQRADRGGAVR